MEVKNHIEVSTSPQLKRLLSLQQNYSVFFNQIVAKINGPLNKDTFIKSLNMVIDKYPILKMRYADGELRLDNNSGPNITCHIHGWEQAGDAWADLIGKQLDDNRNDIINLEELSSEIQLLQISETSALIALSLPWYIADSYSLTIILEDIITQSLNGREDASNKITHFYQYADWQNSLLEEADDEALQFWEHYNFNSYKTLKLPFEKSDSKSTNAIYKYIVDDWVNSGVANLTEKFAIPPAVLLQSCLGILLYKHSGTEDIVLGSVSDCRDLEQLKSVIGPLTKVLPLAMKINPEQQFSDLIYHTAESYDDILTWQDHFILPYENDIEIIPFGFEYHSFYEQHYNGSISTNIVQLCSYSDIFKTRMVCLQTDQGLELNFYHDPKHLSLHSVQLLCTQFEALLKSVILNPNVLVKNLSVISSLDLDLIHNHFNRPVQSTIEEQSFIDLFESQVRKTPNFVAVKFGGNVISYADLNQRSNQLAHYMIAEYDINKGDVVGVMLDHSENAIIAALAILKCGAIFLPIDAGYPQERIKYLLSDASAKLLLTDSDWLLPVTEIYSGQLFAMDIQLAELDEERENPAVTRGNDDPAYIIYTSGSTGKPKGVVVANESFVNYIIYANRYYFNNQTGYPFALFTSLSFDLTVTSIFSTLLRGDTVCCIPVRDIATTLIDIFDNESEVRAVKMTPSHVSVLKGVGVKATRVEKVILGGEAVLCDHVSFLKSLNEKLQIYNEYGPTEATVGCTVKEIKEIDEHLTIGKPIDNATIYVVDEMLKCQPIGVMGELCIGGKVLAKGYLGREDLTHEKFVANPFDTESNQLLYRTGDLARWTADGELEYLGRQDDQVKLNGFRVEIGEIENVLMSIKGIDQAVVILNEKHEQPILEAYYSGNESPSTSEIRSNLERKLPGYMIPAHFVHMSRWPLTVNGKVDRKSLSAYGPVTDLSSTDIKSGNEYEKRIIAAWQKILGKVPDSLDENFFKTGGHSLNGIQLVSQLYKDYGFQIELRDLFDHPTVRGLAGVISGGEKSDYQEIQPVPEQ
ncbi:amino acid adenylation domain-containing protein, partial [Fulvivirga imtechensis]|uniref:non-ribosomal peptide synthetase n=1 Tax=Fulvivirga imtechensis TaxID=881893 RepID=UPI00058F8DEA